MSDQKRKQGISFGWIVLAVLAAMFAEEQFGVFSGCGRACKDAQMVRYQKWLDTLSLEELEALSEKDREEQAEEYYRQ